MIRRRSAQIAASARRRIFRYLASTRSFVGASTQSKRRSTVSGRMTFRYSLRLYGPRSRLQIPQMKLTNSPWVLGLMARTARRANAGGYRPRGRFQSRGFGWYAGVAHGEAKSAAAGALPGAPESVPSSEVAAPWVSSR